MNILITGGHSGIGLELTKKLLAEGHHLGLIIRSEKRKEEAISNIGQTNNIDFFYADLSIQKEVKKVANDIKNQWKQIDGLFNNAGVLLDQAYYSDQENEMQFEINTLSVYLLTKELKALLDQSNTPFIINTATGGLHQQNSLNIESLKRPKKFVKLLGSYMHSKLAMTLLMNNLAKEWTNVHIKNVDPGPNKTGMTAGNGVPTLLKPFAKFFFSPPTKGAQKLYNGAFDKQFHGKSGIYITGNKAKNMKMELKTNDIDKILANINVDID